MGDAVSTEIDFDSDSSIFSSTRVVERADGLARLEIILPDGHLVHTEDMTPDALKEALKGKNVIKWAGLIRDTWTERSTRAEEPAIEAAPAVRSVATPVVPVTDPAAWLEEQVAAAVHHREQCEVVYALASDRLHHASLNEHKWLTMKAAYDGVNSPPKEKGE